MSWPTAMDSVYQMPARRFGPMERMYEWDMGAGYQQYNSLKRDVCGRRISKRRKLDKIVRAQLLTKIDRWQKLFNIAASAQPYVLSFAGNLATPTAVFYPYYAFDLTSLQSNQCGNQPISVYGVPFMRLSKTVATNALGWSYQTGLKADGTTNSVLWQVEKQPYIAGAANAPYEKADLEWADIRLLFVGSTKQPAWVDVQLVRFTDDERQPAALYSTDAATEAVQALYQAPATTDPTYSEYARFWESEVADLCGNPLEMRYQNHDRKGKQVLYSKRIMFQPTLTSETDTTGHQKSLRIFHRMNQLTSYRNPAVNSLGGTGGGNDPPVTVAQDADPNFYPPEVTTYINHVTPQKRSARVFLVIRGFAPVDEHLSAGDPTNAVSFGLMVRRKITVI